LARQVRALAPSPGAWCELAGERIKVLAAEPIEARGRAGTLIDDRLTIACGEGALRLLRLQRPGKTALGSAEFLRGFRLAPGTELR
jgi:methionyl-tRNA formyltransferase